MSENNANNNTNNPNKNSSKNSFRDMMLIIFVVLICFGITIYGIAYLTSKVFSKGETKEIPIAETMPKEVTTNPNDGDTIEFAAVDEPGNEVSPNTKIETKVTKADEIKPADNNTAEEQVKKEEIQVKNEKQAEEIKEKPVVKEDKKQVAKPVKKEVNAVKEPAKKQDKPKENETKKVVKKVKTYVVQITAVQSRQRAEQEAGKFRKKYPDVYVAPVYKDGKTLYRVRLGVSEDKSRAQKTANDIAREFKIKPIVVPNN